MLQTNIDSTSRQSDTETTISKKVDALISKLESMATDAALQGSTTFDLTVLSYQVEPSKAMIPFVTPKSIEEYDSPAYQRLWKAVEDAGLEPYLKKNPYKGNEWAGTEDAYSKLMLAVRIPASHPSYKVCEQAAQDMGFDHLKIKDPGGEVERYRVVEKAIQDLHDLETTARANKQTTFDVIVLSYQVEPSKAMIPFVTPKSIEEYDSPAYQRLWKAVEAAGLEPYLKKNPTRGAQYAGTEDAYSKMVLAARIPETIFTEDS